MSLVTALALALVMVAAGCGAEAEMQTGAGADSTVARVPNTDPNAPIALVVTKAGLAGVPIGSSAARWLVPNAVAAPDGSAAFVVTNSGSDPVTNRFERIDLRTGARTGVGLWVVPGGRALRAGAIEPGGKRVVLTAADGDQTVLMIFDPTTGGPTTKEVRFEGRLDPEAFSTDGMRVFAARSYGNFYRVTTLDVASATQWPAQGPDKSAPPEDMYGNVVQAVLTPDRTKLATLYRDGRSKDRTGFVHLLDLQSGLTVCIDLVAPFGTGPAGTDAITAKADGTIEVGHREPGSSGGVTASFDPVKILTGEPKRHHHPEVRADQAPPSIPDGIAATAFFIRFVAAAR